MLSRAGIERSMGVASAVEALRVGSYRPYLPVFGYLDPAFTARDDIRGAQWKEANDRVLSPGKIARIYTNLLGAHVIPDYSQSFRMASYGSNLPTYERLMYDIDREKRLGSTQVLSVDLTEFKPHMLRGLVADDPFSRSYHRFISGEEEEITDAQVAPGSLDIIWNYRASLYYYLHYLYSDEQFFLNRIQGILTRYHRQLTDRGSVVVDMGQDGDATVQMPYTTATYLKRHWEELESQDLFDMEEVGEGDTKVLVLRKKPSSEVSQR